MQPVINYGAAIWGTKKYICIQAVQNRVYRFYLGVGNFTLNIAVIGEIGWKLPYQRQWENVVRLWGRLCNLNDERLTKRCSYGP